MMPCRAWTCALVVALAFFLTPRAGDAATNYFSVVGAYRPATDSWSPAAGMPLAGRPTAAVAAPDGRIYLFGIEGSTATYAYTPATNSWSRRAPMPTERTYFGAALGGDGKIYTIGGQTGTYAYTNVVEAYDPRTNAWSDAAPIATARGQIGAATGPDGRIYIFGGCSDTGQFLGSRQYATVEVYTPATNSWRALADMPYPATGPTATTGPDGRIYLFGLHDATTVEAYSPASDSWSAAPSLLAPQGGTAVATGPDGRLYVVGGSHTTVTLGGAHGDVEVFHTVYFDGVEAYAPGGSGWTRVAPMPTARTQLVAATGADGRIYAFGGWSVTDTPATAPAAPSADACRFVLGFAALHSALPSVVGNCLGDEQHSPTNGDGLQHTTNGLLVWCKADNFIAFTDGYHTWVNGPYGVQERLNTQRFTWEANPGGLPLAP